MADLMQKASVHTKTWASRDTHRRAALSATASNTGPYIRPRFLDTPGCRNVPRTDLQLKGLRAGDPAGLMDLDALKREAVSCGQHCAKKAWSCAASGRRVG